MSNNLEKSESPTTCSSNSLSQLNIMEISLAWMKTYIKLNPLHAGYLNMAMLCKNYYFIKFTPLEILNTIFIIYKTILHNLIFVPF